MEHMARVWPILCQFGIGGLLCLIGLWAGLSSGYLDLQLKQDRRLLAIFIGGYAGLLALACLFTFWLPYAGGGATS